MFSTKCGFPSYDVPTTLRSSRRWINGMSGGSMYFNGYSGDCSNVWCNWRLFWGFNTWSAKIPAQVIICGSPPCFASFLQNGFRSHGVFRLPKTALFEHDWRFWWPDSEKLDAYINLTPSEQFSVFSAAIYLYYAFGLWNLLNHIKQKLLFKFWNFRMPMKYVWSIVSAELFAGRGRFVNNRWPSIISDVMTNSWSRAV